MLEYCQQRNLTLFDTGEWLMERSQQIIDELIIETMEALISAGLKSTSVWGSYQRYYKTISKFFHQSSVTQYDTDTITAL